MKCQSRFPTSMHWTAMTLILAVVSVFVAFGQTDSKDSGTRFNRRSSEGQTAEAVFTRALAQMQQMLDKQPGETDAAYQARLCLTIRGLIKKHYPDIPKRSNESDAAYQARAGVALKVNKLRQNSLIARPGEEESVYFARLTASKERKSSRSTPRRPGESTDASRVRLQAEKARRTSSPK